jgi:hypothetical protein
MKKTPIADRAYIVGGNIRSRSSHILTQRVPTKPI